jgi:AcrR family transcriptional regulator
VTILAPSKLRDVPAKPKPELQRDAERTRGELLAVATEVFAESGYSGARVDEIAERTRTTKRMIYYYFGGKEQLYLAVLEDAYRGIREAEQKLRVDHVDPVVAIRRLAELTFDHHIAHDAFIRLVSIENIHRGEFIAKLESLREISAPATSVLDEILQAGRAEGKFRDDVDALDVHIVISAFCIFRTANRHTFQAIFGRDMLDPGDRERYRRMLGDLVVEYLTAHVGRA